jgi:hypothetical protein
MAIDPSFLSYVLLALSFLSVLKIAKMLLTFAFKEEYQIFVKLKINYIICQHSKKRFNTNERIHSSSVIKTFVFK